MTGILAGKAGLVTGGGSGLGRATALAMAREGARVAVADLTEDAASGTVALINASGGQAIGLGGNVAVEADVAEIYQGVQRCSADQLFFELAGAALVLGFRALEH